MPFVNVKLVKDVFTAEEKQEMAKALINVMIGFERSGALREVVLVLIEELHSVDWHIGGHPCAEPNLLEETLSKSNAIVEISSAIPLRARN